MAIDKESSGLPSVDFKRRTTKVNLWIVIAVGTFFAVSVAAVLWMSR